MIEEKMNRIKAEILAIEELEIKSEGNTINIITKPEISDETYEAIIQYKGDMNALLDEINSTTGSDE